MTETGRVKEVFLEALELPEDERAAFLDRACAGDDGMRAGVERLIAAHGSAGAAFEPPSDATALHLSPGSRVGPYVLEEELGTGGFGVVFRASQEEPVRRHVALKVVKLGMDTKSVMARFEQERQALALMEHPHIARVFDAGATDTGRPYFVMELVEGVPITEHCDRNKVGIDGRIQLFAQVARAVQHAHQRGILHRDIKPSNVLVAEVDGSPEPKLIDFGIAKATGEPLVNATLQTQEGLMLGTPTYMSPEQLENALDVDTRADVYSLGVLLYELISGLPPFDVSGMGLADVVRSIREEDPPLPSTRRRKAVATGKSADGEVPPLFDVPDELDWIVMRCLEKERDRRYPTANALADDAERFLRDEPLDAAPPSGWYRVRKLVRRHRVAAAGVAAVFLALLLGGTGTTVGLVRAERTNVKLDAALEKEKELNTQLDDALEVEKDLNTQLDDALAEMAATNEELDRSLGETEEANRKLDLALVEARRQTSIADEVNDFLIQDLLGSARPTGQVAKGPDTTVGELLDRAAATLDVDSDTGGRFSSEPLVEASLRYTFGTAYDTLGKFDEAARHMERCVDLRFDSPEAMARGDHILALSYLGMLRRKQGQYEEAAALLSEAYQLGRERFGAGHFDTVQMAGRLTNALREVGRTNEAMAVIEETLPLARETLGEGAAPVTDLAASLAILYADAGRYEEAEAMYREVHAAQTVLLGSESPPVLNAKMNIATIVRAMERYDEAEELYREVIAVQERVEGPSHPHTLTTMFNLAECLVSVSRLEEAEEILGGTMGDVERAFGPTHPRTLLWMVTRGPILAQLGRLDESVEVLEDLVGRATSALGANDPLTVKAGRDLEQIRAYRERTGE